MTLQRDGAPPASEGWASAVLLSVAVFGVGTLLGLVPALWFFSGLAKMREGALAWGDVPTWAAAFGLGVLGIAGWAVVRGSTSSDPLRRRRAGLILGVLLAAALVWLSLTFLA